MKPPVPAMLLLAACLLTGTAGAETVTAFNSYLVAPYFIDGGHGLARVLVDRLNSKVGPRYQLALRHIPRIRLDLIELNKGVGFDSAVLFINPRFVGDVARTRFLWSKPLFVDCNLVISRKEAPIDYQGPASLLGLRFGAVRGYRYSLLDDMARAGKLVREDSQDEMSGLNKVARGRLDLTIVPYTIYSYAAAELALSPALYVAARPLQCFTRHILVSKTHPALLKALDRAIDTLGTDPDWLSALARFHLSVETMARWTPYAPELAPPP